MLVSGCASEACRWATHHAPDVAQEAHENVLKDAGCLKASETLEYRSKWPLAPHGYVEGVMIDDRVGVQMVERTEVEDYIKGKRARDTEAFEASDHKYAEVKLETNAKKRVRRATTFEAWGAEVDGLDGWTGPPPQEAGGADGAERREFEERFCQRRAAGDLPGQLGVLLAV